VGSLLSFKKIVVSNLFYAKYNAVVHIIDGILY
jgi:hypothetical protein